MRNLWETIDESDKAMKTTGHSLIVQEEAHWGETHHEQSYATYQGGMGQLLVALTNFLVEQQNDSEMPNDVQFLKERSGRIPVVYRLSYLQKTCNG